MKNDIDIAWAAGLFEGEGCLTISSQTINGIPGKYKQPRMKLTMTDYDVVKRFHSIVELGQTCEQKFKNPNFKTQLCWYTGNRKHVVELINLFMPYLGERRKTRALELLELCNSSNAK